MGKNVEEKIDERKKGILWHHSSTSLNFFWFALEEVPLFMDFKLNNCFEKLPCHVLK